MTEQEWLTTSDPISMYRHLQSPTRIRRFLSSFSTVKRRVSDRKVFLMLFAYTRDPKAIDVEPPDPLTWNDGQSTETNLRRLFANRVSHDGAACLMREVFGNPFRPISVNPSWLNSTIVSLAEAIYREKTYDRLPILADALEEAGCDNADILTHCRSEGPHVRGCWVVDLVLGKQ